MTPTTPKQLMTCEEWEETILPLLQKGITVKYQTCWNACESYLKEVYEERLKASQIALATSIMSHEQLQAEIDKLQKQVENRDETITNICTHGGRELIELKEERNKLQKLVDEIASKVVEEGYRISEKDEEILVLYSKNKDLIQRLLEARSK